MTESGTQVHVAGGHGKTGSTPGALLTRNTNQCLNRRARATPEGGNAWTRSSCRKQHGMHSTSVVYQATTFPSAEDHTGVKILITVVLSEPQSPDPEVISIRAWTGRDLKRFRAHMGRWYRGVPKNMTVETASNMSLKEAARYV